MWVVKSGLKYSCCQTQTDIIWYGHIAESTEVLWHSDVSVNTWPFQSLIYSLTHHSHGTNMSPNAVKRISVNLPEFGGVCKLCSWLDARGTEDDANGPGVYWVVAGRDVWFSPRYGWYLAKFSARVSDWGDSLAGRPIDVMVRGVRLCGAG